MTHFSVGKFQKIRNDAAHLEAEFFVNFDGVELELLDEISKYNEAAMKKCCTV